MRSPSILLISPLRNEGVFIERLARSVAAQTMQPRLWLALDDHSTDDTHAILKQLEREVACLRVHSAPRLDDLATARDRLAAAAAPRVFNAGLREVDIDEFDFIGKLDGDLELPPDYLERIVERFAATPRLGIAGGDLVERHGDRWKRIAIPSHHVPGALKLYSRDCFAAIGGVRETLGWDTIDESSARACGFITRSYRDIVVRHHRPWASAGGTLRGRARHGVAAWILGYGIGWALLRSLKLATVSPVVASGAAFMFGYLSAAARRTRRADPEFRRHLRAELRGRLRAAVRKALPASFSLGSG